MCCGSLAEARARLASCSFNLLIIDINLPDGNGLELLREVKSREFAVLQAVGMTGKQLKQMLVPAGLYAGMRGSSIVERLQEIN